MDFLNKSLAQLGELFRSMTPGARITAGLLLAVVVVSMGYLFKQGTAGPDAFLFGGAPLSDGELTRIEAAIAKAKLQGATRDGNRIRVPSGQQAAYTAAVADGDALPRDFNTILENALGKAGQWESSQATRERMKIARQAQLSEIVQQFPWVESAVVMFDEQQSRGLNPTKLVTATVNIMPRIGETLDGRRMKVLQKLVSHSVIGLKTEDVIVTNLGEGGLGFAGDVATAMDFDNEYYRIKVGYEQYKQQSIRNALGDIPGIRVEVSADLDDTVTEKTRTTKPDKEAVVPNRIVERTESSEQTTHDGGGRPGFTSQGPGRQVAAETAVRQNTTNKTTSEDNEAHNVVGGVATEVLRNGFTPKEVWATVTLPGSYIESVWKSRNKNATEPPKPEDLTPIKTDVITNVENIVEPLLPRQNKGEDSYKRVKVVVLDTLPVPAIEPPTLAINAVTLAGKHWNTFAMLGVAMFSLLVLRSVVRGGQKSTDGVSATAMPTLTLHTEDSQASKAPHEESGEAADDRPRLRLKKGKSVKDDLVEIVREDPDAAAEILRSWIGKAG